MKQFLCIDPGMSGGWVFQQHGDGARMSGGNDELVELLKRIGRQDFTAVIEKVPPFVGRAIPSSASFKLGYSYGWCVGICQGYGVPVVLVPPQTWQKSAGVGVKGDRSSAEWKRVLKAEAERRYPLDKITLQTSDAYLLLSHAIHNNL